MLVRPTIHTPVSPSKHNTTVSENNVNTIRSLVAIDPRLIVVMYPTNPANIAMSGVQDWLENDKISNQLNNNTSMLVIRIIYILISLKIQQEKICHHRTCGQEFRWLDTIHEPMGHIRPRPFPRFQVSLNDYPYRAQLLQMHDRDFQYLDDLTVASKDIK